MKTRINKKTATIKLESADEIIMFTKMIDIYMDSIYEPPEEDGEYFYCGDEIAKKLEEKLKKWSI